MRRMNTSADCGMGIAEFATEFTEGSEDGAAGRFSLL
jgi:hypothetical protein